MRLPDGSTYLGFGWFPIGFFNGPKDPKFGEKYRPIRSKAWSLGWLGFRKHERYWRHVAFGFYIRWPAGSAYIAKALFEMAWSTHDDRSL